MGFKRVVDIVDLRSPCSSDPTPRNSFGWVHMWVIEAFLPDERPAHQTSGTVGPHVSGRVPSSPDSTSSSPSEEVDLGVVVVEFPIVAHPPNGLFILSGKMLMT